MKLFFKELAIISAIACALLFSASQFPLGSDPGFGDYEKRKIADEKYRDSVRLAQAPRKRREDSLILIRRQRESEVYGKAYDRHSKAFRAIPGLKKIMENYDQTPGENASDFIQYCLKVLDIPNSETEIVQKITHELINEIGSAGQKVSLEVFKDSVRSLSSAQFEDIAGQLFYIHGDIQYVPDLSDYASRKLRDSIESSYKTYADSLDLIAREKYNDGDWTLEQYTTEKHKIDDALADRIKNIDNTQVMKARNSRIKSYQTLSRNIFRFRYERGKEKQSNGIISFEINSYQGRRRSTFLKMERAAFGSYDMAKLVEQELGKSNTRVITL